MCPARPIAIADCVNTNRKSDHHTRQDLLPERVDVEQDQTIVEHTDDQTAKQCPCDRSYPARKTCPANNNRGNHTQLKTATDIGINAVQLGSHKDAAEPRQQTGNDVDARLKIADPNSGQVRNLGVFSNRIERSRQWR